MLDIYEEIKAENYEGVLTFLRQGGNLNSMRGKSPFFGAIFYGVSDEFLHWLIQQGADINKGDRTGETPLMWAARQCDARIVRLLLEAGAEVDATDKGDTTALLVAAMSDAVSLTELINAGADLHHQNKLGLTPLDFAYNSRQHDIAVTLIRAGAQVEKAKLATGPKRKAFLSWIQYTAPAFYAVETGDESLLEELLQAGLSPNVHREDDSQEPILMVAAANGRKQVVRLLLDYKAEVNSMISPGNHTALTKASACGHHDVVKLLLAYGADISHATRAGHDSLSFAAMRGHNAVVRELLGYAKEHGIRLDIERARGWTEKNNHPETLRLLNEAASG